jgi:acetyl esterase
MMRLSPATQAFFKKFSEMMAASSPKPLSALSMEEYRTGGSTIFCPLAEDPAVVNSRKITIPGFAGHPLDAEIFNPDSSKDAPTLIFYPGGGFVATLGVHNVPCSHIAKKANCKVIMVNCRLAPEHQFPIGLEDAYAAYKWILTNAETLGVATDKIMVGGDSSGGNFAALIAIRARDEGLPLAHQFLISPATDLSRSIKTHEELEKQDMLLGAELAAWAYEKYLPSGVDPKDPSVSPYWHSDLSRLAPATIVVAECDGLRSDSDGYAEKLLGAGSKVELIVVPGQVHSFMIARRVLNDGTDPSDIISKKIKGLFAEYAPPSPC